MKYIFYTSTASIYFRPEMLEHMLVEFRKCNQRHGITGLLVYSGGTFLQFIEGEHEQVDQLMHNILKDNIHHSVMIRENRVSPTRMFPDWSMRFQNVSNRQLGKVIGFIDQSLHGLLPVSTPFISYITELLNYTSLQANPNLTQ